MMSESKQPFAFKGKDGWCFLDGDSNRWMDYLRGKVVLEKDVLASWNNLLEYRNEYFLNRKIPYVYLLAPSKERIFLDLLTDVVNPDPVYGPKLSLKNLLGINYIDPTSELITHRDSSYSIGDTHWTQEGAYLAYKKLISVLDVLSVSNTCVSTLDFSWTQTVSQGDLHSKIGIGPQAINYAKFNSSRLKNIENNNVKNIGSYVVFEDQSACGGVAVVFRDSFMSSMMPFLARSFKKTIFVWQPNLDYSIIEHFKPDVVISEQTERFLSRCPDDINGKTNADYVADKTAKLNKDSKC